jgi:ATP-dependent helicase/nuclease subunit A
MSTWLDLLQLSEEQLQALHDPSPRILVAAGAGSGKTLLLTAFYLQALLERKLDVEKVVAVTFTRKAGGELVSRIRSTLQKCGEADLAWSLDRAVIGTIHSLCHRLLRDNALALGLDPAFGVLEAEAAQLAKEQASRLAWKDALEAASEEELEVFAREGDDFRRQMVKLYDRLRGLGHMHPQVVIERSAPSDSLPRLLACAEVVLAATQDEERLSDSVRKNRDLVAACRDYFSQPRTGQEQEALRRTLGFFPSGNPPARLRQHFADFKEALTAHRRTLAQVPLERMVQAMNRLLRAFDQRYREYKEVRGLLDFADLELYAHTLVEAHNKGAGRPGLMDGAWVLVDEFQDTNELQCSILENLGAARLIMVGDERQSIYRFRGADVEVFRSRLKTTGQGLHPLDVNYRSRPQLLAFFDRLFAQPGFFGEEMRPLRPGRAQEGCGAAEASPAVEILVAQRSSGDPEEATLKFREAEALAVAQAVRRLLDEERRSPEDIALLLPTMLEVETYEKALASRGVDVYVVGGKGYFAREEISDLGALLQLLVNPHDDLALCAVLRSPLVGVSDDGLYLLSRATPKPADGSLWTGLTSGGLGVLPAADQQTCSLFLERMAALKRRVGRPGLSRFIDEAVTLFEYDLHLLGHKDGRDRFANLRKLMRMAEEFEALNGPDLPGFAALLKEMEDLNADEGNAPSLAEGEKVVRIMTIHQAKGLEFPVVVLAGLGGEAPGEKAGDIVMVGDDGRMGVFLKGSQRANYEKHDLCAGPAAEILESRREKARQEDVRLLYVAMTRAKERLILVGACSPARGGRGRRIDSILEALGLEERPAPGQTVPVAGLAAVAIGLALPAEEQAESGASSRGSGPGEVAARSGAQAAGESLGPGSEETACGAAAPDFLSFPEARARVRQLSFSALAEYERCPRRFYWERVLGLGALPEGLWQAASQEGEGGSSASGEGLSEASAVLDEQEALSGREVGLLVHRLLQAADLQSPVPDWGELRSKAQALASGGDLTVGPQERERAVELAAGFWSSPLHEAVRRVDKDELLREAPFVFAQDDILISGLVDLSWEDPAGLRRIVDYKTNRLGARSPAEVAEVYYLQAQIYCLAALRGGARRARLDLLFLERPTEPVTYEYGPAEQAALEERLLATTVGIREGRFPAAKGSRCADCPAAELCEVMAPD